MLIGDGAIVVQNEATMFATERRPSFFPYNIIENCSTSVAHNSSAVGSEDLKFIRKAKVSL